MKKNITMMIGSFVLLTALAQAALAQPADNPRPPRRGPENGAVDRPPNPLFVALDANHDGELSEKEIANAPTALAKLDRNHDGKVSRRELRPPGRPESDGARPGAARPGAGRPGRGPEAVAGRLMSQDANGDGKLSQEELPPRAQANFERLDANHDGYIDQHEATAMARRMQRRGPAGGGPPEDRAPPSRPAPTE